MKEPFIRKDLPFEKVKALAARDYLYQLHTKTFSSGVQFGDEEKYLEGAYDLHNHAGPDYVPRSVDMIDEVLSASKYKMHGLAFKEHFHVTVNCAFLIQRYLDEAVARGEVQHKPRIYGGIGLSLGLDPEAVQLAAKISPSHMKVVWFPTFTAVGASKTTWMRHPKELPLAKDGKVIPEVQEIIDIAAENNLVISAGHSPYDQLLPLTEAAAKKNVSVLLDHPISGANRIFIPELKELTKRGAYVGIYAMPFFPSIYKPIVDPLDTVQAIRELGAEHCCIGSDVGQVLSLGGVESLRVMIRALLILGISGDEIRAMVHDVPLKILKEKD
jgi:hypothetical protein